MSGTTIVVGATLDGELHRVAADGTPDLQTVADVDGIYRFVSQAGLEPFGWAPPGPGDLVADRVRGTTAHDSFRWHGRR